jgi:hypothetical protein
MKVKPMRINNYLAVLGLGTLTSCLGSEPRSVHLEGKAPEKEIGFSEPAQLLPSYIGKIQSPTKITHDSVEKSPSSRTDNFAKKIQRDWVQLDSIHIGDKLEDVQSDFTRKNENLDGGWYNETVETNRFLLYVLNDIIVGFRVGNPEMTRGLIQKMNLSKSDIDSFKRQSERAPDGLRLFFLPVYDKDQQLDEGLDFEFYQNGGIVIGYSQKN